MDLVNVVRSSGREHSALLLQGTGLALLFFLFYGSTIDALTKDWFNDSTFSYGVLIPFIAGYFLWERRGELKSARIEPTAGGVVPLAFAVLLGLMGNLVGDEFTQRISMVLALGSGVYLLMGRIFLRRMLFPLCYLMLMIPIPYVLTKQIAYRLRFFDASLAEGALKLLGIPVYREAYFLHLPNITLEVADLCAGLASIFALFALGTFYVFYLPLALRLKALLLLSTFPIAIFANLVRIIVVSALAYLIGPVTLEMLFHRFSGTTTFLLALLLLVLFGELLRKRWPQTLRAPRGADPGEIHSRTNRKTGDWVVFSTGAGIFSCALFFTMLMDGGRVHALGGSGFDALPQSLGVFTAAQSQWDDPYEDAKADISMSRRYVGPGNSPVEVFFGYKGRQNAADRLRSPKLILGEHWNFEWIKSAHIDLSNNSNFEGNWMLARKGRSARLVLYWYQFKKKTVAGELDYRFELVKRLVVDRRSDGAVVRLATPVSDGEPIEEAQERLTVVARNLYPELLKLLPE